MADSDSGLDINISKNDVISSRKKGKSRFYGNKNFRHQNRSKYLGRAKRPTVLNTSSVEMSGKIKGAAAHKFVGHSTQEDDTLSTALHFNAVSEVQEVKVRKDKPLKQRLQTKRASAAKKEKKTEGDLTKAANTDAKSITGPWKSSLFNQNPDIPKVIQPDVQRIQEEFFSKKEFSDLAIHPHLLSYINQKLGLMKMTAIQQNAIPVLLSKKDAMVKSQTGSGKTLAYAVPVVHQLQDMKPPVTRKYGPVALVLVPTRELALQSYEIFSKLTAPFCRIVSTWIIGGENRKSEKSRIRKGVNILIGTPGRILDHIQTTESLSLSRLRWLIFDEADRLLDMGFQKQIDAILKSVSEQSTSELQTVLLSATLSEKVERLASLALKDPEHVHVPNVWELNETEEDGEEECFALPENLTQHVAIIPSKLRLVSLVTFLKAKLLQDLTKSKILVFLSCRDSVEFHFKLLEHVLRRPKVDANFDMPFDVDLDETEIKDSLVFELHGGMSQSQRQKVFHDFSAAQFGVMLTTDVAARGLDLPSIRWVIQYTSPGNPVDYIHRVGRTARAGKKGNALLFLTPSEAKYVSLLTQFNISVTETDVDKILTSGLRLSKKTKNQELWQRVVEQSHKDATNLQNQIEGFVSGNIKIKTFARTAYMSFIRAYATYPSEIKSIFHVKHLHLGHVAKSFGLRDAPSDIVKMLQKSVSHLPIKTSFEYREAKKEEAEGRKEKENTTMASELPMRPRMSRKQIMKSKMSRTPDLMSEFSSGLGNSPVPTKKKFSE